ncbi:MAG: hypothetical protein EU541_01525 [Promethearchaeota archaeon]|nr:MAG: hypothetical protein EU541_01525 [Candidatus Lokiarchaeota archaeon]
MKITPKQIRNQFVDNKIQKSLAIDNLISIIEKSEFQKERVEAMKILEELDFKSLEIYNLFENLLISENNDTVRRYAAEIIGENFLIMGLKPMIWSLNHESTKQCLDIIYSNIIRAVRLLKKDKSNSSRNILQDLISKINKKEFKIPLDTILMKKGLENLSNPLLSTILINFYTAIYLEKVFWRIKYEIDNLQIIKLNFMFKGLTSIPEPLKNLKSLKKLIFRYNQIVSLPEWIGTFKKLKILNLNINELYSLPESVGKLRSLKELYLWKNDLETLPKSIGSLKSLKILNIRLNYLTSLPGTIGKLKNLENLNLHDNKLVFLPPSIGSLKSLTNLNLSWNKIENLPDSIGNLTFVKKLDLGKNRLESLPDIIGELISLETLNLSENKLSNLPENITKLKNLKSLNLFRNKITELPKNMVNLTNLKEIYLGGNDLNPDSDEIKQLKSNGVNIYF